MTDSAQEPEPAPPTRSDPPTVAPDPSLPAGPTTGTDDQIALGELIVDLLAGAPEGLKSLVIADELRRDQLLVREELIQLEELGIVYRTGRTRGTRWWLG